MAEVRELTEEERAKAAAEARKADAEAEKARAEARKLTTEEELARLVAQEQLRVMRAQVEDAELHLRVAMRSEQEVLADDKYHRVYRFTDAVGGSSVRQCMDRLAYWCRLEPGCSIEIVFSSPGGSVIDGNVLFDYIVSLRDAGHDITTSTLGMAASMAGILLQAGTTRVIHRRAWVLIHEISAMAVGKIGEIEDEVEFIHRLQDKALDIFAERCRQAHLNGTAKHPLTRKQIERRWKRKDWWISAEECLDLGLVDELR